MDARKRLFFEQEIEWYRQQRNQAEHALERYEEGLMAFHINRVDVTEEQKARLRRMIEDCTQTIAEIETELTEGNGSSGRDVSQQGGGQGAG